MGSRFNFDFFKSKAALCTWFPASQNHKLSSYVIFFDAYDHSVSHFRETMNIDGYLAREY